MLYYVISLLSQIYCDGPILQAVQDARLYPDSKYFVDMPLKFDPVTTLRDFYELGEKVKDVKNLAGLVSTGERRCKSASREIFPALRSSFFHYPGGRFREFYYWDTFWILKGLLFSEMFDTAKGAILNLAYMVDHHGFVPNGGRVYYLIRSQPPLLTPMVYEYFLSTGDLEFVQSILPLLEKEHNFGWSIELGAT
uniref:Trehalase n=1 Tax=Ditylenchus dipsaci TaxID=166011 RepID=A0A915D8H3_9BILA